MPPSAQTVTPSSSVGANSTVLSADAAAHDEDRSDRSELVERSEPSEDMERGERAENGHHSPESALEAYTERLVCIDASCAPPVTHCSDPFYSEYRKSKG